MENARERALGELDLGGVALGGVVDFEKFGGEEAEHAGENHVREGFTVVL